MKVHDVMSMTAKTCEADQSLADAARMMWDDDVGALPVLGRDGKLCGIITDRDVCMGGLFSGRPLADERVGDHMSRELLTATPEQSVERVEKLMRSRQVRRLPVLNDANELVGMVTLGDLARAATGRWAKGLDAVDVAATLAAVAEPRRAAPARSAS